MPFVWTPELDLERGVAIASRLERSCASARAAELTRAQVIPRRSSSALVGAPVAPDAHRQLEVHLAAELALELAPRGRADRLDHAPAARRSRSPSGTRSRPRSAPARASAPSRGCSISSTTTSTACGSSWKVRLITASRISSASSSSRGLIGGSCRREHERALGHQRREVLDQRADARARCAPRSGRPRRAELELGGLLEHRQQRRAREQPVDLVDGDRRPARRRARAPRR